MRRPSRLALLALPAVLAVAGGWRALDGEFIRDDVLYVVTNPHVTDPVPWATMFSTPFQPDQELGLYRPVTTLSFRLDFVLGHLLTGGRPDPRFFHATNLLLAAGGALLLALLSGALGLGPWASGLAACVFAVHAGRSEAVFWISGRAENLMALFSLASLLAAAGRPGRLRGPVAATAAVLAFWSKEQGAVLPLLVVLLPGLDRRTRLSRTAWVLGGLALAFLWRSHVLGALGPEGPQQVLAGTSFGDRLRLGLGFLTDYARLALWPHPLRNEYDDPAGPPGLWPMLPGAAVLAALAVLVAGRRPRAAFGLALFVAPLLPVLNVVWRTGETFAERFLALPLAGFALLLALPAGRRPAFLILPLAAVAINAPLAVLRAGDFAGERTLYEAQLRDVPESGSSYSMLASHLNAADPTRGTEGSARDAALVSRILDLYEEAIRRAPQLVHVRLEFAKLLNGVGAVRDASGGVNHAALRRAEEQACAAAALAPDLAHPRAVLGETFALQGRLPAAEQAFRDALAREPREAQAAFFLVQVLERRGKGEDIPEVLRRLEVQAREAVRTRPWDSQPCEVLAKVLFRAGRGAEAPDVLREGLRRAVAAPHLATLAEELRTLLVALGRPDEGLAVLDEAARELEGRVGDLRPQADLSIALSRLAQARGRLDDAERWLVRALDYARTDGHRDRIRQSIAGLQAQPRK